MKERMWGQIEVEMCLQRAKTIGQMCQRKQEVRDRMRGKEKVATTVVNRDGEEEEEMEEEKCKQVSVLKNPADDLGIAIVGGKEHNLPVMVSEVFPNSAVARAKKVRYDICREGIAIRQGCSSRYE